MMTALATVTSVQAVKDGFMVGLSCEQQSSCSHCSSQKKCGTGVVSKAIGNKIHHWSLKTEKTVSVGQTVEIGLSEKKVIQYAALVYLLPLCLLIVGALLGQSWLSPLLGGGEGGTILLAVVGMGAGIALARTLSSRIQRQSKSSISIIRVLGDSISVNIS